MINKCFWVGVFLLNHLLFPTQTRAQTSLEGTCYETFQERVLNQVKLQVYALPENLWRGETMTGPDGQFSFSLPPGSYRVLTSKEAFFERNDTFLLGKETALLRLEMLPRQSSLNIYFAYGHDELEPEATSWLNKVLEILKDNPDLVLEVQAHTDGRGDPDYNQVLSEHRAAATASYFRRQGIDPRRITAFGYGEAYPLNQCRDGGVCSEAEHLENRRTTLILTGPPEKIYYRSSLSVLTGPGLESGKNKHKSNPKRQKEANTSVPLPDFKPDQAEKVQAREKSAPAPATYPRTNPGAYGNKPSNNSENGLRILPLPSGFKGYAVELIRSKTQLQTTHPAFRGQKEVYRVLEEDGKFSYLWLMESSVEGFITYYGQKIKPNHPTARLVRFTEKGKVYVD